MPAIFAAGLFPGILAGLAIIVPIVLISLIKNFGGKTRDESRPGVWRAFREAFWGLLAPVVILGGMRIGAFTPTEAAVIAVFYGLFIGFFIYETLTLRDLYEMLVEAGELSAIILWWWPWRRCSPGPLRRLGVVQPIADGHRRAGSRRIRHHRPADGGADHHRHVPRRRVDLPDPGADPGADRQRVRLGPGLVRRAS